MPSTTRPSLASTICVTAGVVWCFLLAVPLMLIVTHSPFTGNPLYTLLIGAAIALTLGGMMLRCRDQLAALTPRQRPTSRRSIIYKSRRPETTVEIRQPSGVYRASAAVNTTTPANVEVAELSERLTRRLAAVDDL